MLKPAMIYAVQVNFYDYKSDMYTKDVNLRHRYTIEGSLDGKNWFKLVDRAKSYDDRPNDYVEVDQPQRARYIRYENIEVPTPNLAISDIRVFGLGEGKKPVVTQDFRVERLKDRRDAMITWKKQPNAQGYNIRWGIAPDKMYSSWLVYDQNELLLKSLTVDQSYYFSIETFNENGVSSMTKPVKVN